ncbi:unnamed protein product [Meganyctiphanes norvegica]|uniref:Uncharacterized protein n=1 Tax=Meganyctiphanes norvegica TaxID=48144 RepID=A0AAV2Q2C4_MEGNR
MPIGPAVGLEGGGVCAEENSTNQAAANGAPAVPSRPPPPPPPRISTCIHGRPMPPNPTTADVPATDRSRPWWSSWNRKYVLLCGTCGASAMLLGCFYLVIYFILRSYTSSLHYFETIPTYVPATVLIVTGLIILCFIRRKNRFSYLIKISGCLCLVCAVLCVVVTVTTTVLHMNRLQTLQECEFFPHSRSCTCTPYQAVIDPTQEVRYVFVLMSSSISCDVIHGPLYSCLRALFGLSVIGILVSIFSCMLVYQLLTHEKKKMYWEQLENRRRLLYRRGVPAPANCQCCDEYGFVPPSELYPWGVWDAMDDRYWGGGQFYSPSGEESSNASRSVLLGASTTPQGQGPIWLPWGPPGAWGAQAPPTTSHQHLQQQGQLIGEGQQDPQGENLQVVSEEPRPHLTGVLLRPFIPRGLEGRLGFRRQHPPSHAASRGHRPLSDPGVMLPRYPPPFSEAYLPPMAYQEAFPRYMWGPPPPYSQPTSSENIAVLQSSPHHHPISPNNPILLQGMMPPSMHHSPAHRPATLADLMNSPSSPTSNTLSSPSDDSEIVSSPVHAQRPTRDRHKIGTHEPGGGGVLGGSSSLPSRHRAMRRLPFGGHVKSLGDVTEHKHDEPLEVLFCDGSEMKPLDTFHSDNNVQNIDDFHSKHIKSLSDPKVIYNNLKMEQESELYFADVSSCVSIRQDGDETLYYSEPTSSASQMTPSPSDKELADAVINHTYEQVREKDDDSSHHASDDTMIVHTSSSNHSLSGTAETENTYSIVSPNTEDLSSTSPMVTDTDAYSCYTPVTPASTGPLSTTPMNQNLAVHPLHQHFPLHPLHPLHHLQHQQAGSGRGTQVNDNELLTHTTGMTRDLHHPLGGDNESEHCYETLPGENNLVHSSSANVVPPTSHTTTSSVDGHTVSCHPSQDNSDLNGNMTLTEAIVHMNPSITESSPNLSSTTTTRLSRANLSLPLRQIVSSSNSQIESSQFEVTPTPDTEMVSLEHTRNGGSRRASERTSYHSSEPNTPSERRIHSVQDLLYTLKSVNV